MANKPRPRCPDCETAMSPVYRARPRGSTYARIPDVFWCNACENVAVGRKKPEYVDA